MYPFDAIFLAVTGILTVLWSRRGRIAEKQTNVQIRRTRMLRLTGPILLFAAMLLVISHAS